MMSTNTNELVREENKQRITEEHTEKYENIKCWCLVEL